MALISFAVTAKLICVFVFAYAKRWFSYDEAHIDSLDDYFCCDIISNSLKVRSFIAFLAFPDLRFY